MRWIELSASVNADFVESVASILGKYGQGGATLEERPAEVDGKTATTIKIYLPSNRPAKNIRYQIEQDLSCLASPVHLVERLLKPADWFDSLKRHFGILEIGERIIIKPSWIEQALPSSNRVVIEIDPGEAFGTGMHTTTRLCLLRLEKHLQPGMSVFDLGTGSGILSIAVAKLGASTVLALDTDPVAVKAALKNVKKNQVEQNIEVKRGTLSLRTERKFRTHFDIVVANITSQAISELSARLAGVLKPGGILIVSGIHQKGMDEVLISLAMADLKIEAVDSEVEWTAVVARKTRN